MPCQAIGPGQGHQGVEAKLLRRPSFGAAGRLIEVLRHEWRRAMARKPRTPTGGGRAVGPDDDDDPIDEMAVW